MYFIYKCINANFTLFKTLYVYYTSYFITPAKVMQLRWFVYV